MINDLNEQLKNLFTASNCEEYNFLGVNSLIINMLHFANKPSTEFPKKVMLFIITCYRNKIDNL